MSPETRMLTTNALRRTAPWLRAIALAAFILGIAGCKTAAESGQPAARDDDGAFVDEEGRTLDPSKVGSDFKPIGTRRNPGTDRVDQRSW